MREHPKHKTEAAIVDALVETDQMESTARNLTSGRCFASLETEEITSWTQAARNFLISYDGVNARKMEDLSSELGLRKVALPCEDVSAETAAVARRIRHDDNPEGHARIRDRIRKFLDDLESH